MTKFTSFFVLGVAVVTLSLVSALTDDERQNIRTAVIPLVVVCAPKFGITLEALTAAKLAKNPDALDSCFYACVLKKTGSINDQGLYDAAAAKAILKKYVKGEADLSQLDSMADTCTSVNGQTVSDGAQGCERSNLLVHCLIQNNISSVLKLHEDSSRSSEHARRTVLDRFLPHIKTGLSIF